MIKLDNYNKTREAIRYEVYNKIRYLVYDKTQAQIRGYAWIMIREKFDYLNADWHIYCNRLWGVVADQLSEITVLND